MCGIIGYCGKKSAAPIVLEGLKRLEYRGYDSAGIASLCDGRLLMKKDVGKIDEVNQKHNLGSLLGNVAIGHTRWATHGSVTRDNAHPHCDCKREIFVVHNGIIENHQPLRHRLERKYSFVSETDSEVIPHLIREFMDMGSSLEQAVCQAVKELRGSYAILAISAS